MSSWTETEHSWRQTKQNIDVLVDFAELFKKVQCSHNQALKKRLKLSNTAHVNKRSFTFKL